MKILSYTAFGFACGMVMVFLEMIGWNRWYGIIPCSAVLVVMFIEQMEKKE